MRSLKTENLEICIGWFLFHQVNKASKICRKQVDTIWQSFIFGRSIVYLYFQGYFGHLLFSVQTLQCAGNLHLTFCSNLGIFHNTSRNHPKNSLQRRSMQSIGQIYCCRMIDRIPANRSVHIQRHSVNRKPRILQSQRTGLPVQIKVGFQFRCHTAQEQPAILPEYYIPVLKVQSQIRMSFPK